MKITGFRITATVIALYSVFALISCDQKAVTETLTDDLYRTDTLIYPKIGDVKDMDTFLLKVGIDTDKEKIDTLMIASSTPPYDLIMHPIKVNPKKGVKINLVDYKFKQDMNQDMNTK